MTLAYWVLARIYAPIPDLIGAVLIQNTVIPILHESCIILSDKVHIEAIENELHVMIFTFLQSKEIYTEFKK